MTMPETQDTPATEEIIESIPCYWMRGLAGDMQKLYGHIWIRYMQNFEGDTIAVVFDGVHYYWMERNAIHSAMNHDWQSIAARILRGTPA